MEGRALAPALLEQRVAQEAKIFDHRFGRLALLRAGIEPEARALRRFIVAHHFENGAAVPPDRRRQHGGGGKHARIQQGGLQRHKATEGRTADCVSRFARAVLAVDEWLEFARQHLRVAIALAAFAARRIARGGVFGDAADAGVVDTDQDGGLDGAGADECVGGDIGAPVLPEEGGGGIEQILAVLQVQHRQTGGALIVAGGNVDYDIARRGKVTRGEAAMEANSAFVFSAANGQFPVYATERPCAENT